MSSLKKFGFILSFCLLAGIAASFIFIADPQPTKTAQAGSEHNISGWAWNDNTGWVSFNCTNKACRNAGYQGNFCASDSDCGGVAASCLSDCAVTGKNYGVNIDLSTGIFSGYAWSQNSGWISFQETPPETAFSDSCQTPSACTGACSACYNSDSQKVFGWAKIINMGDDGWIKLSDDSNTYWAGKGVQINSSGAFTGWAWNANSDGTGIGWISFNKKDCDTDGNNKVDVACGGDNSTTAVYDYYVQASIVAQPQNVTVTQSIGSKCSGLRVQWGTPVTGADGFYVYRDGAKVSTYLSSGTNVFNNTGLNYNQTYGYIVRACGDETCAMYNDSISVSGKTNAVCEVSFGSTPAVGICPNQINLSWLAATGSPTSYHVYRCDATGQVADYCDNNANYSQAVGNCWDTANITCTDEVPVANKSHQMYYKVAGYNSAVPEEGDWSDKIGPYVACPKKPIWEEVKP